MKYTWHGGMTLAQVEMLERTFAQLTKEGWVIPQWVISLKQKIIHHTERKTP